MFAAMFLGTVKAPSRNWLVPLVILAALWAPATSSAATTIGSNLAASANGLTCGLGMFHEDNRDCRTTQGSLIASHIAPGGITSPIGGVIVGWTVKTGAAPAGLASLRARPRIYHGAVLSGGSSEPFATLPITEPGLHSFAARLPIQAGDRIGVEVQVTNIGTQTAWAPIVHAEPAVGTVLEQVGSQPDGHTELFNEFEDRELLLSAQVEPDADHDGFGDETQDRCATNPATQGACPPVVITDTKAPRTKLTYPARQDFLASKSVTVRLRSSEDATAIASGQLELGGPHDVFGIFGDRRAVRAGKKVTLELRIPRKARKAAKAAIADGTKVVIKVTASARDAAGNESGKTIAVIKPPQPRRR